MKKTITILTVLFIVIQIFPVSAGIIGGVTETDIVTFIDYCPVRSYNYDGFTYVIAEDLSDYGFKVSWNENDRTLDISRDELVFASYCSDFINEKKTGRTYAKMYDVYTTDIKTFINGKEADAYNINGCTIINTADLSEYGIYSYDDRARRVDIKILEKEIENCETENTSNDYTATEKHGIFANGELAYGIEKTTYTDRFGSEYSYRYGDFQNDSVDTYDAVYYRGNVVNGVAHGYGTMYNKQYGYSDTVNTTKTLMKPDGTVEYVDCPSENVMYTGYFKDGLMDGYGTMYENSVPTFQGNHTCGIINGAGTEYKDTGSGILYVSYIGNYENNNRNGQGTEYEVKSISDLSQGLFERFVGEWKDGGWSYGKWYECVFDPNTNILTPYLYKEGSFNN